MLIALEKEKTNIEESMADPDTYENAQKMQPLQKEYDAVLKNLEKQEKHWLDVQDKLG